MMNDNLISTIPWQDNIENTKA